MTYAIESATEKINEMMAHAIFECDTYRRKPTSMKTQATEHKIIIGDSRNMPEIRRESTHVIVTSPPYWQLKDYGDERQIGFHHTYEQYIENLNSVWAECFRVLRQGCRLVINIGDQFARAITYGRYKIIPIREDIIRFCESIGFDYMGAIIWQKKTTMNTTGGASVMGSFPYPRNGLIEIDYEFILLFKKLGKPPVVSQEIKEQSKLAKEEWRKYFTGHWNFAGEKQTGHIAMFPEELPRRIIKMFSFVGETVLDPFLGSGTTVKVARDLGRNSIGYEINSNYLPIIKEKTGIDTNPFLNEDKFEIVYQPQANIFDRGKKPSCAVGTSLNNRINDPEYWKVLRTKKRLATLPSL